MSSRVGILGTVGEIMAFQVSTVLIVFGDVDARELEDDRPRAVVTAGDHHAVVVRPAMHDGTAGERRIDVARNAIPGLRAGKLQVSLSPLNAV